MAVTAVFKGGAMNGIEMTYEVCKAPGTDEEMCIRTKDWNVYGAIATCDEVYVYIQDLQSWVYDHRHEVVEEE